VEVEGVVALGGVARPHVVDLVCSNLGERSQGGNAQDCGGNEYGMVRKIGPERTHEGRRHGIAGAGEAIISADTRRHSMPAGDTEADSGDRWADEGRARAVKTLGNDHPGEPGRSARMSAAAAMNANPDAANARFQRTASASAPPGICAATAANPPTVSASPTFCFDQPRSAK